jgi:hypothetical protein
MFESYVYDIMGKPCLLRQLDGEVESFKVRIPF